jgi:hypothetical protein
MMYEDRRGTPRQERVPAASILNSPVTRDEMLARERTLAARNRAQQAWTRAARAARHEDRPGPAPSGSRAGRES